MDAGAALNPNFNFSKPARDRPPSPKRGLAADAPYRLVRLANGACSVHAEAEAETFHPVIGPAAEAEALYINQTGVRERLAKTPKGDEFIVWDVGLGAAANAISLLRATAESHSRMGLFSFDRTTEPAWFALRHQEALGYLKGYADILQRVLSEESPSGGGPPTGTRFLNGQQEVRWLLRIADFPTLLESKISLEPPHLVLFDAFSPATNPEMWTLSLFQNLRGCLIDSRPCLMPTYSRSTMFRVTLLLAGFFVGRGHATGEKEETTVASNALREIREPLDRAWLRRAERSTSAEPLRQSVYTQSRLALETWEKLQAHPQFA